jgi:hypothetical protein
LGSVVTLDITSDSKVLSNQSGVTRVRVTE